MAISERQLGIGVSLFRRQTIPSYRLDRILCHAVTFRITPSDPVLRAGMVLFRRATEPFQRLRHIQLDVDPVGEHRPEPVSRLRVSVLRLPDHLPDPRPVLQETDIPRVVCTAEIGMRVPFFRLLQVGLHALAEFVAETELAEPESLRIALLLHDVPVPFHCLRVVLPQAVPAVIITLGDPDPVSALHPAVRLINHFGVQSVVEPVQFRRVQTVRDPSPVVSRYASMIVLVAPDVPFRCLLEIVFHAPAVGVAFREGGTRRRQILFRRLAVPFRGFGFVPFHAVARIQTSAVHELRVGIPRLRGLPVPFHGLCPVLSDALALGVEDADPVCCARPAAVRRFPVPVQRLGQILPDVPFALLIQSAQHILRLGIACFRRLAIQFQRLGRALFGGRAEFRLAIAYGELEFRPRIPQLRRFPVEFPILFLRRMEPGRIRPVDVFRVQAEQIQRFGVARLRGSPQRGKRCLPQFFRLVPVRLDAASPVIAFAEQILRGGAAQVRRLPEVRKRLLELLFVIRGKTRLKKAPGFRLGSSPGFRLGTDFFLYRCPLLRGCRNERKNCAAEDRGDGTDRFVFHAKSSVVSGLICFG